MSALRVAPAPHVRDQRSSGAIMRTVLLAAVPGVLLQAWFFGWGTLLQILWCCALALVLEAGALALRKRPITQSLNDSSALVTGLLLGLALPAIAPWWIGFIGMLSALWLGKHIYGGLGQNPFNPAMIGYLVLLIAFPIQMSQWGAVRGVGQLPDLSVALGILLEHPNIDLDAWTGATALETFKLERGGMYETEFKATSTVFGSWSGRGVEWINLGFLLGGLWMLQQRLFHWHGPIGMLGALVLLSLLFYDGGSSNGHGSPLLHLFSGATMLGAFFILTDPVSSSASNIGRLLCGVLTGVLVYCIRVWSNYPEAVAFAVLLANFTAPLLDHYIKPRPYGHQPLSSTLTDRRTSDE